MCLQTKFAMIGLAPRALWQARVQGAYPRQRASDGFAETESLERFEDLFKGYRVEEVLDISMKECLLSQVSASVAHDRTLLNEALHVFGETHVLAQPAVHVLLDEPESLLGPEDRPELASSSPTLLRDIESCVVPRLIGGICNLIEISDVAAENGRGCSNRLDATEWRECHL
jgi:hypothetical protein